MRILALNLRAGANALTIPQIVRRAAYLDAETVVFSEFRDTRSGALMRSELERIGLGHQAITAATRGNGVLIASDQPFEGLPNPFGLADDEYPNAVLRARFEDFQLYGVYLPGQDRKRPHIRCLIAAAKRHNEAGDSVACIGDFNSGRNETDIEINVRSGRLRDEFSTADLYHELEAEWTEAWAYLHPERYEFSWYPFRRDPDYRSRAGWRIDKAFLSPALLPKLTSAEYDHVFRTDGLSDHSGLVVDLDWRTFTTFRPLRHWERSQRQLHLQGAEFVDVLTLLKNDHKTVGKLLDEANKCEPGDGRLEKLAGEIEAALTVHATIEEKYFYPQLHDRSEESDDVVDVFEAYTEHELIKTLIALLKSGRQPDEQFKAELQVLAENVKHHVKEEESTIFSLARETLHPEELEELGAEMEAAKKRLMAQSPGKARNGRRTSAKKASKASKTAKKSARRTPGRR